MHTLYGLHNRGACAAFICTFVHCIQPVTAQVLCCMHGVPQYSAALKRSYLHRLVWPLPFNTLVPAGGHHDGYLDSVDAPASVAMLALLLPSYTCNARSPSHFLHCAIKKIISLCIFSWSFEVWQNKICFCTWNCPIGAVVSMPAMLHLIVSECCDWVSASIT